MVDAYAWYNRVVVQEFATRKSEFTKAEKEAWARRLLRTLGDKIEFGAFCVGGWVCWLGGWGRWVVFGFDFDFMHMSTDTTTQRKTVPSAASVTA